MIVYIREAHPEDGWVLSENREAGIAVPDPQTLSERAEVATTCSVALETTIPMLLDDADDGPRIRIQQVFVAHGPGRFG